MGALPPKETPMFTYRAGRAVGALPGFIALVVFLVMVAVVFGADFSWLLDNISPETLDLIQVLLGL